MFLSSRNAHRWEQLLSWYLKFADCLIDQAQASLSWFLRSLRQEDFRCPRESIVVKLTLLGILITCLSLSMSCQTQGARRPLPLPPVAAGHIQDTRKREPLYIRKETPQIQNRFEGSTTGSIYAEATRPLDLFADSTPLLSGDHITITIPQELQFTPPSSPGAKNADRAAPGVNKGENNPDTALAGLMSEHPQSLQAMQSLQLQPAKQITVQIVGTDPSGRVYFKGTKSHSVMPGLMPNHASGSVLTITGHLHSSKIRGKAASAEDVMQVEVSQVQQGIPSVYSSAGWDTNISRIVSGYTPDLTEALQEVRSLEGRITQQQRALTDRYRSLRREQESFLRERNELLERMQQGQNQTQPTPQNTPQDGNP